MARLRAIAVVLATLASPAWATDPAGDGPHPSAEDPAAPEAEEILITGTRISRRPTDVELPVLTFDERAVQRWGTLNAEDLLRGLPVSNPGVTRFTNNGNPGVTTVNLRGLDDERTLVLLDGVRMAPYDSEGIADLNNVPLALVDRVEVLTSGASSAYGSDAIAGVVNFVLKRDFEGVIARSHADVTSRGDAFGYSADLTVGRNFERGNVTAFASWSDRDGVAYPHRSFGRIPLDSETGEATGSLVDTNGTLFCEPQCQSPGMFGPESLVGFESSGDLAPVTRAFNPNPFSWLQVPQARAQATLLSWIDVTDGIELLSRASFASTRIETKLAPSGVFGEELAFALDNPFWTSQALRVFADRDADGRLDRFDVNGIAGFQPADFITPSGPAGDEGDVGTTACPACAGNNVADPGEYIRAPFGRRFPEVGPRIGIFEATAYQWTAGFRGDLPGVDGWSWDASYAFGRTRVDRRYQNDVRGERVEQLLAACAQTAEPGCVLSSLFGDGTLSAAAAEFIAIDLRESVTSDQHVLSVSASGDLDADMAIGSASPIGAAVGLEWRREASVSDASECFTRPGCSVGFGTVPEVRNAYRVAEAFAELRMPLLEGAPHASEVTLETGVRLAHYSTVGFVSAFKIGMTWAPIESLHLRGVFQRAVRAPNIFEFGAPRVRSSALVRGDPCARDRATGGTTISASLRDLCVATGAPESAFGLLPSGDYSTAVPDVVAGEVNAFVGGNPRLDQETARMFGFSAGHRFDGPVDLSVEIDWYRVEIRDAIAPLLAQEILEGCYDPSRNSEADSGAPLCKLIERNPRTGGLVGGGDFGVVAIEQNLTSQVIEGLDLRLRAQADFGGLGSLEWSFAGSFAYRRNERSSPAADRISCAHRFGGLCGSPRPGVRFEQSAVWKRRAWSLGARWRFFSSTNRETGGANSPTCAPGFCSIASTHYFDTSAEWAPLEDSALSGLRVTLVVQNLFDKAPPVVGTQEFPGGANTYPDTFDPLGRTFTLSLSREF